MENLETLHLDSNQIEALPDGVFDNLEKLTELSLSRNKLFCLPDGIFDYLRKLKYLFLGWNNIKTLPDGIFDILVNLEKLSLYSNKIKKLPTEIFDNLENLETLYLDSNRIEVLPDGVFDNLEKLEILSFTRNLITSLPTGIFDILVSLRILEFDRNKVYSLLTGIFYNLVKLERLSLYSNKIEKLPTGIFDHLEVLNRLHINSNFIEEISPDIFDCLINLEYLNMGANRIKSLAAGIFDNLNNLKELKLNQNEINSLPVGIFNNLIFLEYLDFECNGIRSIPDGLFDNLKNLKIHKRGRERGIKFERMMIDLIENRLFDNFNMINYTRQIDGNWGRNISGDYQGWSYKSVNDNMSFVDMHLRLVRNSTIIKRKGLIFPRIILEIKNTGRGDIDRVIENMKSSEKDIKFRANWHIIVLPSSTNPETIKSASVKAINNGIGLLIIPVEVFPQRNFPFTFSAAFSSSSMVRDNFYRVHDVLQKMEWKAIPKMKLHDYKSNWEDFVIYKGTVQNALETFNTLFKIDSEFEYPIENYYREASHTLLEFF